MPSVAAPEWLVRFVADELRPLFRQQHYQTAALEALIRWRVDHERRRRDWNEWNARRIEYQVARTPPYPPYPEREPDKSLPLPPPDRRDPRPDELWVALLAVHDECRDGERIVPESFDYTPFFEVCHQVLCRPELGSRGLNEANLRALQEMLRHVGEEIAASAAGAESPPNIGATSNSEAALPTQTAPTADEPSEPTSRFLSSAELAEQLGIPDRANAVDLALRQFAESHPDCREPVQKPRKGEPRVIYRVKDVWPFLHERLPRWRDQSATAD
jgi:hypothetical protein